MTQLVDRAPTSTKRVLAGRYRVDGKIARGGMSWVYRGTHLALGTPVAIKLLSSRAARSPANVERFHREARLAAKVPSHNVVDILDIGADQDGTRYVVMDHVPGRTLAEELRDGWPCDMLSVCRVGRQLAQALADVHAAGIVHRDVKPGNLLVSRLRNGAVRCVLIDFGIASMADDVAEAVQDGLVWGTPTFMAPEQAKGAAIGPPADVYALGLVLYELVARRRPFLDAGVSGVMRAHVRRQPPPICRVAPHCAPEMAALIHRCLSKSPRVRPSAIEVLTALEHVERVACTPMRQRLSASA